MRARLISIVPAVLLAGVLSSLTACGHGETRVQPVPTFPSAPVAGQAAAKPRTTLLPTDCADVVGGVDMSALLGQPVGSVQAKSVIGVGSPSVGMLERLTCYYRRATDRDGTVLDLRLQAYTTDETAAHHSQVNINAERSDARQVEELTLGSARGVLFTERGQSVLMISSGRSAVTMTLRDGTVPIDQTRMVMLDLTQRVLPNLAPEQQVEPR